MDLIRNLSLFGGSPPPSPSDRPSLVHGSSRISFEKDAVWRDSGDEEEEGGWKNDSLMMITTDDQDPTTENIDGGQEKFHREVIARLALNAKISPEVARSCARLYFIMQKQITNKIIGNGVQMTYDESDVDAVVDALKESGLPNAFRPRTPTTVSSSASARWSSKTETSTLSAKSSPVPSPRSLIQYGSCGSGSLSQIVNCQFDYTTCEGVFEALQVDLLGAQEIAACRAIGNLCRNDSNAAQNRIKLGELGACEMVCAKYCTSISTYGTPTNVPWRYCIVN